MPIFKDITDLTDLERDLLEAADSMLAHSKGMEDAKTYTYQVPHDIDVKAIRHSVHLKQEQFAHFIGATVHAVRHWENGRRKPTGTAKTLLSVSKHNPHAVLDALRTSNHSDM